MSETKAEQVRILRETAAKWRLIGNWHHLEWLIKEADAFEVGAAALEREGQPVAMGILANYSQELGEEFLENEEEES
jgi:hypothetical protein